MTYDTRAEQRKARLRFAALYVFSLLLLFVVMTAFWKRLKPAEESTAAQPASEKEMYYLQMDTTLHQQLERLDDEYAAAVEARQRGQDNSVALVTVRREFAAALDSLDQQAAYLAEGPKKSVMQLLSAQYRKDFADRDRTVNAVFQLPKLQPATINTGAANATSNAEVEDLKKQLQEKDLRIAALTAAEPAGGTANAAQQLAEKDKTILALQAQLKQKEAALQNAGQSRPVAGGGEWQQRYSSLKSAYDKVAASEKTLRASYQSLADDNRRLLAQVQSLRKQ